jgi:hypothetical protein
MSSKTETRLTPGQRLRRGLAYTAAGPVDVTRGAVGLSAHSLAATAAGIRRRYHDGRLRREVVAAQDSIGRELAAAQEIVVGLPQALQDARVKQGRTKRPLVIVGVAAVVLAAGGAAFAIVRRSARPTEPSPRPPSVDFDPKP